MAVCWTVGCNHNNLRETCKFFRLPKNHKDRKRWLRLIRRREIGLTKIRFICSCHFPNGDKKNGPQLCHFGIEKAFPPHYCSPERRKKRVRRKLCPETEKDEPSTSTAHLEVMPLTSSEKGAAHAITSPPMKSPVELEVENYCLHKEVDKPLGEGFNYDTLDDALIPVYTGLPSKKIFDILYNLIENIEIIYVQKFNVGNVTKKNQLLMTLMKLRQNFPHADLAYRFRVTLATVTNIVITFIHVLYDLLYVQFLNKIPPRKKCKSCLQNCFHNFTNCRIILDCTEIYVVVTRHSLKKQNLTYSSYKHRHTLKGLVGVAPNGVVTYVSNLFPGSTSAKKIVENCGIIDQFEPGDLILADEGFLIRDLLPEGVHLNIPPFLVTPQFSREQSQITETIAQARLHIKRAIRRIKGYKILNLIPYRLTKYSCIIFKVVGALTNLQNTFKEVGNLYGDD